MKNELKRVGQTSTQQVDLCIMFPIPQTNYNYGYKYSEALLFYYLSKFQL